MRGLIDALPADSIASDPLVRMDVYLFISRAHPDAEGLRDRLDAALRRVKQRGDVQRILAAALYRQ